MKKISTVLLSSLLFVSLSAFSANQYQTGENNSDVSCKIQAAKGAEAELHQAYTQARERITASLEVDKNLLAEHLLLLHDSQTGWLKYRDGQCKIEAFIAEVQSVAYEVIKKGCIEKLNKDRIYQLNNMPYE
ncbi:lysozyme inhibitor LprI family protein [Mixta intestinalis]|uniref:lysozyme inhibitor LprI family protein n=1 Tax=Mixta intestinalis TaxID=1615494 RepID=UPI001372276A|nr:lysozyme inhibitor LprI family protein [Mixta intestinalis]